MAKSQLSVVRNGWHMGYGNIEYRDWTYKRKLQKRGYGMDEYRIWLGMKQRCLNPKARHYNVYGGRGITIDPRWMEFDYFFIDMGARPGLKYSLDRIDNNGPYSKDNCKWSTRDEQMKNRQSHKNS
jgi:hypothetical protein